VLECLSAADTCGLYQNNQVHTQNTTSPSQDESPDTYEEEIMSSATDLELEWQTAYDQRRDNWRKNATISMNVSTNTSDNDVLEPNIISNDAFVRNGQTPTNSDTMEPSIQQDIDVLDPDRDVDINRIIADWNLNEDQARAFRIISRHSLDRCPPQLRMYLGGPAGSGKSRVISALKDFFIRRGQHRRFRLASYMGVAARNITGMTLHAALCLNQNTGSRSSNKTQRNLTAMWEGVDYLFIDEVSMIGSRFLCQISEALTNAKGNTSAFGGINIIFAGDFAQLPPVGDDRLYAPLSTKTIARAATKTGQQTIFGKLLWYSIKTVVMLNRIERQSGQENQAFVELLSRLREGRCSSTDYAVLKQRVITETNTDLNSPEWKRAPLIVSDNAVKDAMNNTAAIAFAHETNRPLHWYYASDKKSGNDITDPDLNAKLQGLHSGRTQQRLGKIPLVLGMPVMITRTSTLMVVLSTAARGL
jgi:hypothetical protein